MRKDKKENENENEHKNKNKNESEITVIDIENTFKIYKEKFTTLEKFGSMTYDERKNSKLGTSGGIMYISTNGYIYQSMERWWYKESRYDLLNYLDKEFSDYWEFLLYIMECKRTSPYNKLLNEVIEKNQSLIMKIIGGLEKAKFIYLNFNELSEKIDTINRNLNNFIRSTN